MQIYLVGGAVRDQLLGLEVKDRDWVVVGATPEQMIAAGYRPVGKDFPVFLHPETHEEYALARTERKSGKGYKGFTFHTDPGVKLEQDLIRRDLRINAMAMDEAGNIFDPYDGQADILNRQLRHVSEAFSEDPLRVLRVARFAARFNSLGFEVAPETQLLMRQLSQTDELLHLSAERVWQEFERALNTPSASTFLSVLRDCDALEKLMPELLAVPQDDWLQLDGALLETSVERFALLAERLVAQSGVEALTDLCERLRIPKRYLEAALDLSRWGAQLSRFDKLKPQAQFQLFDALKLTRSRARLHAFDRACTALYGSAIDHNAIERAVAAVNSIAPKTLIEQGFSGPALGVELRRRQLEVLENLARPQR